MNFDDHIPGARHDEAEAKEKERKLRVQLTYRLHVLAADCRLIQVEVQSGARYHNLALLEKHLEEYRKICSQVKKN